MACVYARISRRTENRNTGLFGNKTKQVSVDAVTCQYHPACRRNGFVTDRHNNGNRANDFCLDSGYYQKLYGGGYNLHICKYHPEINQIVNSRKWESVVKS